MIRTFKTDPSLSLLGATFIALPVVVAALTPTLLKSPGSLDWLRGEWTLAYEKEFDAKLAIRDLAVSTWSVIEYSLFKGGRPGVLVGDDDWLFTTEDFQYFPDGEKRLERAEQLIFNVSDFLKAKNISLVVAVVPDKSRVYPEHLGRYSRPDYVAGRFEDLRSALIGHGIVTPDIFAALVAAKQDGEVFLQTDTHWTPSGAEVAAETIAEASRRLISDDVQKNFVTAPGEKVEHRGDLLNYIPLGPLAAIGPKPDIIETLQTVASDDRTPGLFDEVTIPVALVGTSYSANRLWNFAGALSENLQAEVTNAAQEGKGPFLPMMDYLTSADFREAPPAMVVWEIPERFVEVEYNVTFPFAE